MLHAAHAHVVVRTAGDAVVLIHRIRDRRVYDVRPWELARRIPRVT